MTTFREIFRVGEFRALFAANAASVAGRTMQMLALSSLVYATTGSPLLAALAYLGGLLPQGIGALTLLSWADRVRPRGFLAGWDTVRMVVALVLASRGLPVWGMLVLVMALGAVDAVASAVRISVLVDVLPGGYVLGRSALNISVGAMQILGFAVGSTIIATLGPSTTLLLSAVLAGGCAAANRFGLKVRAPRAAGTASVAATWRGNRTLFGRSQVRNTLFALWLPNGLIVGAEAMFVPYAGDGAGVLFIAAAAGMLVGDVVVGRWLSPALRDRLISPLQVLLAVPYLVFFARPGLWWGAAAIVVASIGYGAGLGLQQRLVDAVPPELRGQALGLDSSGRMTMQAVAATLVGAIADLVGPALAMSLAAAASLVVTGLLWSALRPQRSTVDTPAVPARV